MKDKDQKLIWEAYAVRQEDRRPGEPEVPGHDDDADVYDELRDHQPSNEEIRQAQEAVADEGPETPGAPLVFNSIAEFYNSGIGSLNEVMPYDADGNFMGFTAEDEGEFTAAFDNDEIWSIWHQGGGEIKILKLTDDEGVPLSEADLNPDGSAMGIDRKLHLDTLRFKDKKNSVSKDVWEKHGILVKWDFDEGAWMRHPVDGDIPAIRKVAADEYFDIKMIEHPEEAARHRAEGHGMQKQSAASGETDRAGRPTMPWGAPRNPYYDPQFPRSKSQQHYDPHNQNPEHF
jgi:hypothetical protein